PPSPTRRGRTPSPTASSTPARNAARRSPRTPSPRPGSRSARTFGPGQRREYPSGRVTLNGHPTQHTKVREMPAEAAESVFPQLEALLPHVQKPIQYVGGELNSTVKPWDSCDVRWALMYPDAYEVGLPNQGVMILYEVLNEQDGVLAERTYSV